MNRSFAKASFLAICACMIYATNLGAQTLYMNPIVDDCCFDDQGSQVKCKNPTDPSLVCVSKNNMAIINASAKDRRTLYDAYKKLIGGDVPQVLKRSRNQRLNHRILQIGDSLFGLLLGAGA